MQQYHFSLEPYFSRRNNFPKNKIKFQFRKPHSARKAIFGFLLEHLDFPMPINTTEKHVFLRTPSLAAFDKRNENNLAVVKCERFS